MNFSSVDKYLTLSLASLETSVIATSICFHLRNSVKVCWLDSCGLFVSEDNTFITILHSLLFSCSVIEFNRCILCRQWSSSVIGPASLLSPESSLASTYTSMSSHQDSNNSAHTNRVQYRVNLACLSVNFYLRNALTFACRSCHEQQDHENQARIFCPAFSILVHPLGSLEHLVT